MGRYTQMNDDFDPKNWGGEITLAGPFTYFTNSSVTLQATLCAKTGDTYGNRIISDLTFSNATRVLRINPELQQADSVYFYRTGPSVNPLTNMTFLPGFYVITNGDYIDRHGTRVTNNQTSAKAYDQNYVISLFQ